MNATYRSRASARGFTLIELMITVTVVAILAAVSWPSYTQYVKRGRRSSAKAAMMDLANREQQYLLANRTYADTASLQASGYAVPAEVSQSYTWSVGLGAGPTPTFTITLTPIGAQVSDGALTLDQAGNRTPISKWQQ